MGSPGYLNEFTEAYDPLLFGGSYVLVSSDGTYVDNETTWSFNGTTWVSDAYRVAPPCLFNPSSDFDPNLGGVVLEGVVCSTLTYVGLTAVSWLLNGSGWTNLTAALTDAGGGPPSTWQSAFAFDPAISAMLLVGGCSSRSCAPTLDQTWALTTPPAGQGSTYWKLLGDSHIGTPAGPDRTGLVGGGMVYDPLLRGAVYFGGDDFNVAQPDQNGTYLFDGTRWVNLTSSSKGCPSGCYPAADGFPLFTWDGELSAAVLFQPDANGSYQDSWALENATWVELDVPGQVPAAYVFAQGAAVAPSSALVPPLIYEPWYYSRLWIWEPAPTPVLLDPTNRSDSGQSYPLTAQLSSDLRAPRAFWHVDWGDGNLTFTAVGNVGGAITPLSLIHPYSAPGSYTLTVIGQDFAGVPQAIHLNVITGPALVGVLLSNATVSEAGSPIRFTASANGGDAPIGFDWSFGDGLVATGPLAVHRYLVPGNYTVGLHISDAAGGVSVLSVRISVIPALLAQAFAEYAATDIGVPVGFTSVLTGGSGALSDFEWEFGDNQSSTALSPVHAFEAYGRFPVVLAVRDSLGFRSIASLMLQVNSPLGAYPFFGPSPGTVLRPIYLLPNVSGGTPPISYEWSFGDGTTSPRSDVSHVYLIPSEYQVTLWANDSRGSHAVASLLIDVVPAPVQPVIPPPPAATPPPPPDPWEYATVLVAAAGVVAALLLFARTVERRSSSVARRPK
ncbi:MAG: PKD domain-containing protein [Thermoplasmata archaeon]|nr:PKD domain-containing protein [Thermoplasmata archaeon]